MKSIFKSRKKKVKYQKLQDFTNKNQLSKIINMEMGE